MYIDVKYCYTVISMLTLFIPYSHGSWGPWNQWGQCSRLCGGGIAYSSRKCDDKLRAPCKGRDARYKICNTQTCDDSPQEFRAQQCSLFDLRLPDGTNIQWFPVLTPSDPCALICESSFQPEPTKHMPQVADGTTCSAPGSAVLRVCVKGKCKPVGCDDIISSTKSVDKCGVCGGDGNTCETSPKRPPATAENTLPLHASNKQKVVNIPKVITSTQAPLSVYSSSVSTTRQPTTSYPTTTADNKVHSVLNGVFTTGSNAAATSISTTETAAKTPSLPPTGRYESNEDDDFDAWKKENADILERLAQPIGFPMFLWYETPFGECSVPCGMGERRTAVVCRSVRTHENVSDDQCPPPKPTHRSSVCSLEPCKVRWLTPDWGPCSVSCGGGLQERDAICVEVLTTGAYEKTDPAKCESEVPDTRRSCNVIGCPTAQWFTGQWSPCSASCGVGVQYRPVVCKATAAKDICDDLQKPADKQQCHTGVLCEGEVPPSGAPRIILQEAPLSNNDVIISHEDRSTDFNQQELRRPEAVENSLHQRPYQPHIKPGEDPANNLDSKYIYDYDYRGFEIEERDDLPVSSGELPDKTSTDNNPSFYISEWGSCSVSCGRGFKTRLVQCRVMSAGYSNTVVVLPESRCEGKVPESKFECNAGDCPSVQQIIQLQRYAWKFVGYEACPVTCGGGLQAAIFRCTRFSPDKTVLVDNSQCERIDLPQLLAKSCNEFDCPASLIRTEPRWRQQLWGECTQRCGPGGVSNRQVECVREIAEGQEVVVDERVCTDDKPSQRKLCNRIDCPPEWHTGSWTQCSVSCGGGSRTRQIHCQQLKWSLDGQRVPGTISDQFCPTPKPPDTESCDSPSCPNARIQADPSRYVQLIPRKAIRLSAGGEAQIIEETRVRVRCYVKNFSEEQLRWTFKGRDVEEKGRVKRSNRGLLMIRRLQATDTGIYTCHAGDVTTTWTLTVITHAQARQQQLYRESMNTRVPEFLDKFHNVIKNKSNRREEYTEPFLFRHFPRDELPLKFVTSEWDPCNKSCGGAGLQGRRVTCELNLEQYYLVLKDINCVEQGLDRPLDTQDCGYMACPTWRVGDWNICSDAVCVAHGQGSMQRPLYCYDHQTNLVTNDKCDPDLKPEHLLPCSMDSCKTAWVTSVWTQCSRTCGGDGIRTRVLQCVWIPTKQPAGNACDNIPKPDTQKPCITSQCPQNVCVDQSKHCELVKMLNLCRYLEYRMKCCWTCTATAIFERHRIIV